MRKKEYPYQNLLLEDIKGEQWEDIPGLGGYYLISDFGRIKRMEYEMQYRNGAIYTKPEKIIKPMIVKTRNKFVGDHVCFLTMRVRLSGKRYSSTLTRLVYHCFVEPFDLDDSNKVILAKDCDNFNITPSNLIATTLGQKQTRIFERDRSRSPLLDFSEDFRKKIRQKIISSTSKQVTQYTKTGRKIKTYSSASAAQKATGIFATSIGNIANGNKRTAGNFVWRWGNKGKIDFKSFIEARKKENQKNYGIISVTQYNMEGNRIAQYASLTEAQEATGINGGAIRLVTKGVYKSAKGYFWKKGYGKEKIDLSGYKWGRASTAATQSKKVEQYALDGKYIQSFKSVKEAAIYMGVTKVSVSGVCLGYHKTCGGYKWKYAG